MLHNSRHYTDVDFSMFGNCFPIFRTSVLYKPLFHPHISFNVELKLVMSIGNLTMDSRLLESTTVIHSDFYYEVQYTFARRRDIKGRQHNIEPDGRNLSGPFVVTT